MVGAVATFSAVAIPCDLVAVVRQVCLRAMTACWIEWPNLLVRRSNVQKTGARIVRTRLDSTIVGIPLAVGFNGLNSTHWILRIGFYALDSLYGILYIESYGYMIKH